MPKKYEKWATNIFFLFMKIQYFSSILSALCTLFILTAVVHWQHVSVEANKLLQGVLWIKLFKESFHPTCTSLVGRNHQLILRLVKNGHNIVFEKGSSCRFWHGCLSVTTVYKCIQATPSSWMTIYNQANGELDRQFFRCGFFFLM